LLAFGLLFMFICLILLFLDYIFEPRVIRQLLIDFLLDLLVSNLPRLSTLSNEIGAPRAHAPCVLVTTEASSKRLRLRRLRIRGQFILRPALKRSTNGVRVRLRHSSVQAQIVVESLRGNV
jgi:hypothetical protein